MYRIYELKTEDGEPSGIWHICTRVGDGFEDAYPNGAPVPSQAEARAFLLEVAKAVRQHEQRYG